MRSVASDELNQMMQRRMSQENPIRASETEFVQRLQKLMVLAVNRLIYHGTKWFFSHLSTLIFSIFSLILREHQPNLLTNPSSVCLLFQMWVRTYLTCWIFLTLQTNSFSHQIQVNNHRMSVAPPLSHTLPLLSPCHLLARKAFRKISWNSWWTGSKSAWYKHSATGSTLSIAVRCNCVLTVWFLQGSTGRGGAPHQQWRRILWSCRDTFRVQIGRLLVHTLSPALPLSDRKEALEFVFDARHLDILKESLSPALEVRVRASHHYCQLGFTYWMQKLLFRVCFWALFVIFTPTDKFSSSCQVMYLK